MSKISRDQLPPVAENDMQLGEKVLKYVVSLRPTSPVLVFTKNSAGYWASNTASTRDQAVELNLIDMCNFILDVLNAPRVKPRTDD